MNLQMDPLDNPLTTRPIQTGCEMSIQLYPNWRLGCIDDLHCPFGNRSVPTRTPTRSTGPELLLTLLSTHPKMTIILPSLFLNLWVLRDWGRNRQNRKTPTTPHLPPPRRRHSPGARIIIPESPKDIPWMNVFVYKRWIRKRRTKKKWTRLRKQTWQLRKR